MSSSTKYADSVSVLQTSTALWGNSDYIKASDNRRAECQMSNADSISDQLLLTDFGFTIPEGSTIDGIEVTVECRTRPSVDISIFMQLLFAGSSIGNIKYDYSTWQYNDSNIALGGSSDTWGTSITASSINISTFGLAFFVSQNEEPTVAEIDAISITIHYTEAATTAEKSVTIGTAIGETIAQDNTVEYSVTISTAVDDSGNPIYTLNQSVTIQTELLEVSSNQFDQTGLKIITSSATYNVDRHDTVRVIESKSRDYQINNYESGGFSIYYKSAWRTLYRVILDSTPDNRTLIKALRQESGLITMFPLFYSDKSEIVRVRVDPRAPLVYDSGALSASRELQIIFYKVVE